jgi:hypothetical protein
VWIVVTQTNLKKEGETERKNREKIKFFVIFFEKNELPLKNKNKLKKMPC